MCAPEFRLVGARMRTPKCNATWECPPSRGRATDVREKESPLPVYDPKVEGRRIGLARSKEKPPGRALGRTGHVGPNRLGLGLRRKRNGPRPVSRRAVGIARNGGDDAAGGGSRPWTPRRRHERVREIALGAADASLWLIGTSPALNQSESGGKVAGRRVMGSWSTLPGLPGI
ncbi:hypothetical protein CRG98_009416 [Punica granatum]|uniref:Uncharacterized protein n=1 Tax=Punica granatum TaxID=22663 RepID=A0A2I0KP08_PUNGR|nr:hypothetical protein CRG98_009416 [Punica granatum]